MYKEQPIIKSESIDENPKIKIRHTYLELGIFRNIKIWGKRKICSTVFIFRKRSSFAFLSKLIIKRFKNDEELKTLRTNLKIKNFSSNYSKIISNKNFLIACWVSIKPTRNNVNLNSNNLTEKWFVKTAEKIKNGLFQFSVVKYNYKLKFNKKLKLSTKRTFKNKIIQEGIKFLLKITFNFTANKHFYNYQSNFSHHIVLNNIKKTCKSVSWYVKGNITQQFQFLNYEILLDLIKIKIKDIIFINLINKYLKIKFREFYANTFTITNKITQKDVIFSVLYNIYSVFFDNWLEKKLIISFNKRKKFNFKYFKFYKVKSNNKITVLPLTDNLKFKRIYYFRYLNTFIVSVYGSKKDCTIIIEKIHNFLKKKLNLNLNANKTDIICAKNKLITLLSNFTIQKSKLKKIPFLFSKNGILKRIIFKLVFKISVSNIIKKLEFEGYIKNYYSIRNVKLINYQLTNIIEHYKIIERKIFNYYFFSGNYKDLVMRVHYILKFSCVLTIASKMKLKTKKQVFRKYGKNLSVSKKNEKKIFYSTLFYFKSEII